jgi:hypothetical protein
VVLEGVVVEGWGMAAEEVAQEWAAAGRDGKKMVAEGVAAEGAEVERVVVGGRYQGRGGLMQHVKVYSHK